MTFTSPRDPPLIPRSELAQQFDADNSKVGLRHVLENFSPPGYVRDT